MLTFVSPRCGYLPGEDATDRPLLGVVRGDRLTLRIDSGNSPAHNALMERAMAEAGLPRADMLVLTHSHWDHTFGMAGVACPVFACRETQEALARMKTWRWRREDMARRLQTGEDILFCHEHMLVEYPEPEKIQVRLADVVFEGRLTLNLGGVRAEVFQVESSHADDCVLVHVPEERVLFCGDTCYEDLHHEPPCIHARRYEKLQGVLREMNFAVAVMGHFGPMTKEELLGWMEEMPKEMAKVED